MGKLNGYAMCVKYDLATSSASPNTFGAVTEASISLEAQTTDVTNKDSEVDENGVPYTVEVYESKSATINVKAYCSEKNDNTAIHIGDKVVWTWGKTAGTAQYSGTGIVTAMSYTGGATGKATRDITIKSVGEITV